MVIASTVSSFGSAVAVSGGPSDLWNFQPSQLLGTVIITLWFVRSFGPSVRRSLGRSVAESELTRMSSTRCLLAPLFLRLGWSRSFLVRLNTTTSHRPDKVTNRTKLPTTDVNEHTNNQQPCHVPHTHTPPRCRTSYIHRCVHVRACVCVCVCERWQFIGDDSQSVRQAARPPSQPSAREELPL